MTEANRQRLVQVAALPLLAGVAILVTMTAIPSLAPAGVKALIVPIALMVSLVAPRWLILCLALPTTLYVPFAFGDALVVWRPSVESTITVGDVLILVWIARQTLAVLSRGQFKVPGTSVLLAAFVAWLVLATWINDVSLTPALRFSAYAAVGILLPLDDRANEKIYRFITLFAVGHLVVFMPQILRGLLQTGIAGDPHEFAMLMIAGACGLLGSRVRSPWANLLTLILLLAAALTFRRSIWAVILLVFLLSVLLRFGRASVRSVLVTTSFIVVIGITFYTPVSNVLGLNPLTSVVRYQSVQRGLNSFLEHPVTGVGWAGEPPVLDFTELGSAEEADLAAHFEDVTNTPYNVFVNVMKSTGSVGFVLLLAYFLLALQRLSERQNRAAFLFCSSAFALSMVNAVFYAGSLLTLMFFVFAGSGTSERDEPGADADILSDLQRRPSDPSVRQTSILQHVQNSSQLGSPPVGSGHV